MTLGIPGIEDAEAIGSGGFATVYRARQPAFNRTVALKILSVQGLDETGRRRFQRECQAMGALSSHPGIVTIYDAGFTAAGLPYLVMEHMPGGSIADRIKRVGAYGWEEASRIGVKLAAALETAHRSGILHRDIKPANVLLSSYGEPQLSDFGIARLAGQAATRSGVITASFAFAPPEIVNGQPPSAAADVYALAATLHAMISGLAPFSRESEESLAAMLARIERDSTPDLRVLGVPHQLCLVLERGMAKVPEQRQRSAEEFGREVQAVQSQAGMLPTEMLVPRPPQPLADVAGSAAPISVEEQQQDAPARFTAAPPVPPTPAHPPAAEPVFEGEATKTAEASVEASGDLVPPRKRKRRRVWRWIAALVLTSAVLSGAILAVLRPWSGDSVERIDPPGELPPGVVVVHDTLDALPGDVWYHQDAEVVAGDAIVGPSSSLRRLSQTPGTAVVVTFRYRDGDAGSMEVNTQSPDDRFAVRVVLDEAGNEPQATISAVSETLPAVGKVALTLESDAEYSVYLYASSQRAVAAIWPVGSPERVEIISVDNPVGFDARDEVSFVAYCWARGLRILDYIEIAPEGA